MKKTAAFIATCVVSSCAAISPYSGISQYQAAAEDGYSMNITVDLKGERKEISPLIYGVNQYTTKLKDVRTAAVRQGGNRMTAYNWVFSMSLVAASSLSCNSLSKGEVTTSYVPCANASLSGKYPMPPFACMRQITNLSGACARMAGI